MRNGERMIARLQFSFAIFLEETVLLKPVVERNENNQIVSILVVECSNGLFKPFSQINNYLLWNAQWSSNTKIAAAHDLISFFTWLAEINIPLTDISSCHLLEYRDKLIQEPDHRQKMYRLMRLGDETNVAAMYLKGRSKGTINRVLNSVSCFLDYCTKTGKVPHNICPTGYVIKKKIPGMLSHISKQSRKTNPIKLREENFGISERILPFTKDELQNVFDAITHPQEILLVCMLLLGLRIGEALGCKIDDIRWQERMIYVKDHADRPSYAQIKYNSVRIVPIQPVLYVDNLPELMFTAYNQYIARHLLPLRYSNQAKWLFIKLRGDHGSLSHISAYSRIIKSKLMPNVGRQVSFHSFRHHFATTSLAIGVLPEEVQKILGHKNISTTIESYYNPSLQLLGDLAKINAINPDDAEKRVAVLKNYKRRFVDRLE